MTPPGHAVARFPNEASSSGGARRFVKATLEQWALRHHEEVACLLVSELVSNALLHAGTDLEVHLHRRGSRMRVEVHDRSPRLPERKHYSATSVTGRGLVFVSELADAWGFEPTDDGGGGGGGKAVWFELDDPTSQPGTGGVLLEPWDDPDEHGPAAAVGQRTPGAVAAPGDERSATAHRSLVGVR